MSKQDYIKKVFTLLHWSKMYYVEDKPVASDEEYDRLYHEVKKYEETHPEDVISNSPTTTVGGISNAFSKSIHKDRMWSQNDIFSKEELLQWLAGVYNVLNKQDIEFALEPKYDGLSLKLTYKDGLLIKAVTRGDGVKGEDVTNNARVIKSIPLEIPYKKYLDINGEIVMLNSDFIIANERRDKEGKELFANPRNAAAGSLRTLDMKEVIDRKLTFYPWGLNSDDVSEHMTVSDKLLWLEEMGFTKSPMVKVVNNINSIMEFYQLMIKKRSKLDVGLDGLLIKVNDVAFHRTLGYTNKYPKWSCAFKFPAVEKTTKILDIKLQVGRLGTITPVAMLDPITLDGSTVSNVTLNNFEDIKRKDIRILDEITLIKSGDIIPKVVSIFKDRRTKDSEVYKLPTNCPTCDTLLVQDNSYLKCPNVECIDRVTETLKYFTDRDHMDLPGFGDSVLRHLIDVKLISSPLDLYKLSLHGLESKSDFGSKTINNLLTSITNSLGKPLWLVLGSIGIPEVGRTISKVIFNEIGINILTASESELLSLKGVGPKIAKNLSEYTKNHFNYLQELIMMAKVNTLEKKVVNSYVVCVSGIFTSDGIKIPRKDIESKLINNGYTLSDKMTKKVSCLITGEKYSVSKMVYAEDNRIPNLHVPDNIDIHHFINDVERIIIKA